MKTGRTKHVVTLLAVLLISCLLIGTIDLSFADSDTYYPGPDVTPEEPIIIVTPTSEPEVTPTPTPRPTPTTEPTPAITPEPSVPVPVITPVPKKEKEYTLTIYYKYEDGTEAATTYREKHPEGELYEVHSPDIPGYHVTIEVVSGRMPGRDLSIVVYYYRDIEPEEYKKPLGMFTVINIGDCYE